MRSLSDCDPNSTRRLIMGALPEWRALLPFAPVLALIIYLACRLP